MLRLHASDRGTPSPTGPSGTQWARPPPRCELVPSRSVKVVGAGRASPEACGRRSRSLALLYSAAVLISAVCDQLRLKIIRLGMIISCPYPCSITSLSFARLVTSCGPAGCKSGGNRASARRRGKQTNAARAWGTSGCPVIPATTNSGRRRSTSHRTTSTTSPVPGERVQLAEMRRESACRPGLVQRCA
jgi:hypothetical protein